MTRAKAVIPKSIYENDTYPMSSFNYAECVCPICHMEVPYANYCCECGQKFKNVLKLEEECE
jgi:predicted amidophosphoribosyltransferase